MNALSFFPVAREIVSPPHPYLDDRTAAGITRVFADAGRDLPVGMADALADRIARDGGLSQALGTCPDTFSLYSDVERWLHEMVLAVGDAMHPENPLSALLSIMPLPESPVHPGSKARDKVRAARLWARIEGITVEDATARLDAWLVAKMARAA